MTIDFGAHLYPADSFPALLSGTPIHERLGSRVTDPERLRELYDEAGIDGAVLSQPFYMGSGNHDATAAANDALCTVVDEYERFYGLGSIPVAAGGDVAAEEFERVLDLGLHGGAVETKTDGIELTDSAYEPVFEVASATGAPVFVHPKLNGSIHPDAFPDDLRLNAIFGREMALAESISKVIHDGVFERYPDLTLIYHHFGGNLASMLGRIHLQLDPGRWPGQDHVEPYEEFHARLTESICVDTSGFFGYDAPLRTTLDELPASQVLFGTDYPYEPRDASELASFVDSVERVVDGDGEDVLSRNAKRVLANV